MRRWLSGLVLVVASIAVYGRGLSTEPPAPGERDLADRAALVASTAARPLGSSFVRLSDGVWLAPALLQASALLVRTVPSATSSTRLLSMACGAADVLLLYLVALRLFNRTTIAFGSALILLFTPAHALFSRTAPPEGIWPVPFILAWALSLHSFTRGPDTESRGVVAAGMGSLILAGYTQPTAVVMIPLFGAVTIAIVRTRVDWTLRDLAPALLTVTLLSSAIVFWSWTPGPDGVSFARWLIAHADLRAGQVASAVLSRFWNFFLPSHLFLTPENRGFCGLFLTAASVPIAIGVYACLRNGRERAASAGMVIVASCMIGPLTAALCGPPSVDARSLTVLPFTALLAGWGSAVAWRGRVTRPLVVTAFVAMAVQAWLRT